MTRLFAALLLAAFLASAPPPASAQCTSGCAGVVSTKSTGNQIVDGIWKQNSFADRWISGQTFMGLPVITYSFYDADSGPYDDINIGAVELSDAARNVIRSILFRFSFYTAGVWFSEVTEPGTKGQIGAYWERCYVCGRGVAFLNDGRIIAFCSKRRHEEPPR